MYEMTCKELVERVTDYLEGALSPSEQEHLERHLSECDGCQAHLEQIRVVLRLARALPREGLSEPAEEQLTALIQTGLAKRAE